MSASRPMTVGVFEDRPVVVVTFPRSGSKVTVDKSIFLLLF